MSHDYKYAAQVAAEEEAEERFGCDFYDLPPELQAQLYQGGLDDTIDKFFAAADAANYREREEQ